MRKEKVLVTGGGGLVGNYLLPLLVNSYQEVYATEHQTRVNFGIRIPLDLKDLIEVKKILCELRPNVIVNLAAFTDVDGCEENPVYADIMNHRLPTVLIDYVADMHRNKVNNTHLVHVSTDYIFDGIDGDYKEESLPNPVNQYGKSKLLGEQSIMAFKRYSDSWCIARTSTPFGIHRTKKTFPLFILEKLVKGEKVCAVVDQITSPTYAANLSDMLLELILRRLCGIYHVAGASRLSRYDQALKIARMLNVDNSQVCGVTSENMNWVARRPRDSSLSVAKSAGELHSEPAEFDSSLKEFIANLRHLSILP